MKQTHTIPKNLGYVCVYFVITYSLCSQTDLYICHSSGGYIFIPSVFVLWYDVE